MQKQMLWPSPTPQPKSTEKKTLYSLTDLKTTKNIRGIAQMVVSGGYKVDVGYAGQTEGGFSTLSC